MGQPSYFLKDNYTCTNMFDCPYFLLLRKLRRRKQNLCVLNVLRNFYSMLLIKL